jgi:tetratricopeptide (TPR) repeat protein
VKFIVDRFGFDAVLRMLTLYREKAQTADILTRVLKLSESDFDKAFKEYVEAKTRPMEAALKMESNLAASLTKDDVVKMLAAQDTFALHLRAGHLFRADDDIENAVVHFRRAIELFPYYVGEGNAYDALAEIFQKKGDQKQTAEVLAARVRYDENSLPTLKALASLRAKLGDRAGAIEALRLSFYVSPFEYATHAQAGELSMEEKQYARALSEFQVVLALDPPNLAEANYNVASAYHLLGKQPEAKHAVLRALEAAPSYEKAQELLLKIRMAVVVRLHW